MAQKILVVDDEQNIRDLAALYLEKEGFAVDCAPTGMDALERFDHVQPSLVILDVMMPGMDGFEVARQIRENPDMDGVKMVFLTAKGTQRDKAAGYASGAEYYLVKPFDNDELVQTITEIITYG